MRTDVAEKWRKLDAVGIDGDRTWLTLFGRRPAAVPAQPFQQH
ncbi:hypothetical protein [Klebsiella oxytoca]